ncbi:sensor histidine kinase [Undibacterium aquatile]|uniref:Histidine kinase n=1 Tax=Undibacterium aquatile TaxID=1537398 RepID=A0ABR6XJ64_9BURK|nr:histidine kinase [Undibacterium aquatile]MBC3812803.1 histidine kinase [Undibacterium aquatile]
MTTVLSVPKNEPVIPDCCNIGVIFRVLAGVSVVVLLGLASRGDGWALVLENFIEASMLIEAICLLSLFLLCACRRYAYSHASPVWLQRLACVLIPAAVSIFLLAFFGQFEWFLLAFPRLNTGFILIFTAVSGFCLQQYFELRTRAFSPALGEARLQALQARIRPHFLFNSLNTALSLIRKDPRRAESVIEDLSDLFRVLMRDTRTMTSLHDELHLCRQYLAIESLRLGERLQLAWNTEQLTDDDMRQIQIPVLLLQPILENAVHYGVEPSSGAATIFIDIQRGLDKIEIRVRNSVHQDARLSSGNQMALDNIRQRLKLLYDVEAQLSIRKSDDSFEVILHFPAQR